MGELISDVGKLDISNDQRREAALHLASRFDKATTALFLVMLGLASHDEDERFRSTEQDEQGTWFEPDPTRRRATLELPLGELELQLS